MSGADQTRLKSTLKLGSMSQRLGAPVQHLPHFIRPPAAIPGSTSQRLGAPVQHPPHFVWFQGPHAAQR